MRQPDGSIGPLEALDRAYLAAANALGGDCKLLGAVFLPATQTTDDAVFIAIERRNGANSSTWSTHLCVLPPESSNIQDHVTHGHYDIPNAGTAVADLAGRAARAL